MLNRPRSSLPTTRRMSASRFSARSSGGMSRVPIAAWNVRLSRLRTRTVLRIAVIRFVGSAVGGTGRGIRPRGPRTTPSRFPTTGIRGASEMKKSYDIASSRALRLSLAYSSISWGWMTRSATARAFKARSPEAKTHTRIGLPRPLGSTTSSSRRFLGMERSTSRRFTATSTDSVNSRGFAASRSFLIVSTECLSAKGNRLLQCARPREPPARRSRRKRMPLIRLCGPRPVRGLTGAEGVASRTSGSRASGRPAPFVRRDADRAHVGTDREAKGLREHRLAVANRDDLRRRPRDFISEDADLRRDRLEPGGRDPNAADEHAERVPWTRAHHSHGSRRAVHAVQVERFQRVLLRTDEAAAGVLAHELDRFAGSRGRNRLKVRSERVDDAVLERDSLHGSPPMRNRLSIDKRFA